MMIALLVATALMADTAAAATPATPPAAPAAKTAQVAKKDDPNAMVCKSEPVLGSRMPAKKCRTQAQAAMEKEEARQQLDKMQGATYQPH